jgi:hypothetical protein
MLNGSISFSGDGANKETIFLPLTTGLAALVILKFSRFSPSGRSDQYFAKNVNSIELEDAYF